MNEQVRKIPLTRGKFAIVDDADFKWLNQWKWHCDVYGYATGRANRRGRGAPKILMHRLILDTPKGAETDHINHNTLDNRRTNLRVVNRNQNNWNQQKIKDRGTSIYKGVCWNKKRKTWQAQIAFKKKNSVIGQFKTEHHAAVAYDLWADYLFGEYAKLNFQKL